MAQKAQKEVITMENTCKQCPYNKGVKEGNGLLICPCVDENSFYSPCEFQAFDKIWVEIEDEEEQIILDEYLTNQECDEYDFWLKLSEF